MSNRGSATDRSTSSRGPVATYDVESANEQMRKMSMRERELLHELDLLKTIYANDMKNAVSSVCKNEELVNEKEDMMQTHGESNLRRIVTRWKQASVRCLIGQVGPRCVLASTGALRCGCCQLLCCSS